MTFVSLPKQARDLSGQTFGRLLVLGPVSKGPIKYRCRCSCERETIVAGNDLTRRDGTKSCGCLQIDRTRERHVTHGHACGKVSLTYKSWAAAKRRSEKERDPAFNRYGGAGIRMCEAWSASFETFLLAMGERPSLHHSLDRIDNARGYEPGNCRWATRVEQSNNRRSNVRLSHAGQEMTIAEWARAKGIDVRVLKKRHQAGWSTDRMLDTPTRSRG